ncbi:MAG: efflux RND transporter periplasmic adaptor subunit [Phycisphaerae bacterium]|nr:efflux RND transporter periplasmic adaptor subunit [Phycisphaerae bacterium]
MMIKIQSRILGMLFTLLAGSTSLWADGGVAAITKPSGDVTLSFVRPGRVMKILVKEGETVKVGQVLVQQDDDAEQVQLAQLKAQAEDTTRIKAAEAQWDQKKLDLKRIEWAAKRGASTELEVDTAELDVLIAKLALKLAQFQREQDNRKFNEAKLQIGRMRLESPISGKVERVFVKEGESVDALEDVIRIVNIAPLWIDVPVPLGQARLLKNGLKAVVEFAAADDTDKADNTAVGKIVHIASVADAASNTLMVRVEVPNPTGRPAGEHVRVGFIPAAKEKSGKSNKARSKEPASQSGSEVGKVTNNNSHRRSDGKSVD